MDAAGFLFIPMSALSLKAEDSLIKVVISNRTQLTITYRGRNLSGILQVVFAFFPISGFLMWRRISSEFSFPVDDESLAFCSCARQ